MLQLQHLKQWCKVALQRWRAMIWLGIMVHRIYSSENVSVFHQLCCWLCKEFPGNTRSLKGPSFLMLMSWKGGRWRGFDETRALCGLATVSCDLPLPHQLFCVYVMGSWVRQVWPASIALKESNSKYLMWQRGGPRGLGVISHHVPPGLGGMYDVRYLPM